MHWAAVPLSEDSLQQLKEWDIGPGDNIHPLMKQCLHRIIYLKAVKQPSDDCEEDETYLLNEISDDDSPMDVCPPEIRDTDSKSDKCAPLEPPLQNCSVDELIKDLVCAVDGSSENKDLWFNLANSKDSHVVDVLKQVWSQSFREQRMKKLIYSVQNKNFIAPELFWKEVVFQWFSSEADPLEALGKITNVGFVRDIAFFEGFVNSVLKTDVPAENSVAVTKLIEFLTDDMKLLGLGVYLRNITGSLQPLHLNIITTFLDAVIAINEDTLKILVQVLNENVVGLKNNRQMGMILISLLGKLQPGLESTPHVVSVCSKYVGAMRFRIAKAIKDLDL